MRDTFVYLIGAGLTDEQIEDHGLCGEFIESVEFYLKVGISKNPDKRRADLQTGSPLSLVVLDSYGPVTNSAARKLEATLHSRLKTKDVPGGTEWAYTDDGEYEWCRDELMIEMAYENFE